MIGTKHDSNKTQWHLVPWEVVEELAQLYTKGAEKYSPHNWKVVPDAEERYADALMRHFTKAWAGEAYDPETGASHWTAVAWNAIALRYLERRRELIFEDKL